MCHENSLNMIDRVDNSCFLGLQSGNKKRKPVLCVHGWLDNAGSFETLVPLLNHKDYYYVAIDLPGHGTSSHIPVGAVYNFFLYVRSLYYVIKHFKWQSVTLMGHSLGSKICILYASFFPHDVLALILLDTSNLYLPGTDFYYTAMSQNLHVNTKYEAKGTTYFKKSYSYKELLTKLLVGYNGAINEKSAKILQKRNLWYDEKEEKYYSNRDTRLQYLDVITIEQEKVVMSKIECKVYLLRAVSHQNDYLPRIADLIPDVTVAGVYGTHHVHLNDPDVVSSHLNDWLDEIRNIEQKEINDTEPQVKLPKNWTEKGTKLSKL